MIVGLAPGARPPLAACLGRLAGGIRAAWPTLARLARRAAGMAMPACLALAAGIAGGRPARADLLVSSSAFSSVVRFDATTGAPLGTFVTSGEGGLDSTDGMAWGPGGNLYVCSERSSQVLRYDGKSGAFLGAFVAAGSGGLDIAENLVFGPDGNLYVASIASSQVLRYDGKTGAFLGVFVTAGAGGLDGPTGLVFGPDGDLYVASTHNSQVLRYDGGTGAAKGALVSAGSGGLNTPVGIAFGADGSLLASSLDTDEVLRYDGKTGAFLGAFVTAGSGGLKGAYGIVFGPDGNLYVNSYSNNQVLRYDGRTGAFLGVFASGNGLLGPTYLIFSPPASGCQDDDARICLQQARFQVSVAWQTPQGTTGAGHAVRLTTDTATFWFFDPANLEMVVKVLDGCALAPGRFWVFAGGLTDVAVTLTVADTTTGATRTYHNPQGTPFAPLQDTAAFPCP